MNPPKSTRDPIPLLYSLLGRDAVLLPLLRGKKSPTQAGWQNVVWQETQLPIYQTRLRQGNIGVLVGVPSNGLCSIDCDSDEVLENFLNLNPTLRNTLVTVGKRGGNIWVKVRGEYPRMKTLKNFGEWRSTGGQTVIWGVHPDGPHYRFRNEAKVFSLEFSEIKWPDGFNFGLTAAATATPPPPLDSSVFPVSVSKSCIPVTVSCVPVSLHHDSFAEASARLDKLNEIESRQEQWFASPKNSRIAALYRELVLRSTEASVGHRNAVVVDLGKRLFHAVSPAVAMQLLTAFYEINAPFFKDSLEQHQREVFAMLAGCEITFRAALPQNERQFYEKLPERFRPPYRICRDLAARNDPRSPCSQFFMSADSFGRRLGVSCSEGDRMLKHLVKLEIIRVVKLGERRTAGRTPRSTEYAWIPPFREVAFPALPSIVAEPDENLFAPAETASDKLEDLDEAVF